MSSFSVLVYPSLDEVIYAVFSLICFIFVVVFLSFEIEIKRILRIKAVKGK